MVDGVAKVSSAFQKINMWPLDQKVNQQGGKCGRQASTPSVLQETFDREHRVKMRAVRPRLKPAPVPTIFPSGNAISSPSSSRKNPSRRGAFKKQRRQEVRSYFHAPMTFKNGDYELSRWTKKSRRVKCMYLFCIHGKLPDMEKPFCMAYYQHPHSLFSAIVVVILHMIHIFNFHA